MPRDFMPCVYYEHETTDTEGLAWYIQGKVIVLHQTPEGAVITEDSRLLFLEDWDVDGDAPPTPWMTHAIRRQWLREALETMRYSQ